MSSMLGDQKQTKKCCIVLLFLIGKCVFNLPNFSSFVVSCKLSCVLNRSINQYQTKRVIPSQLTAGQPDQPQPPVSYCRDD